MRTNVQIDAAIGGVMDKIGAEIEKAGKEDASGARRYIAERLKLCDFRAVMNSLPHLTLPDVKALREACVAEWGQP